MLPRLYAILDAETCARRGFRVADVSQAWFHAGVRLLQYRDKISSDDEFLRNAATVRADFGGGSATLVLNDRVHLFAESGFDGVHVGQTDLAVGDVRRLIGQDAVLGVSTHNVQQVGAAAEMAVNYVAVGPVFVTGTKLDAEPVIGLAGVRAARALTEKPLVAIGGITAENAAEVLAAGADSVAVISGLLPPAGSSFTDVVERARDFLALLK